MMQAISPCQVCGHPATGYEWWRDFEEVGEMVELWPGGPVVEERTSFRKLKPTGSHIKLEPCGHEQPDVDAVRVVYREVVDRAGERRTEEA